MASFRVWSSAVLVVAFGCAKSGGADSSSDGGVNDPNAFKDGATSSTLCQAAVEGHSSVGCDYYAVHMDGNFAADNGCFAVFLANTSGVPARVEATFDGVKLDLGPHVKIPRGSGRKLTYEDYAPAGIAPGDVGILFLAGPAATGEVRNSSNFNNTMQCPVLPALSALTQIHGTGRGAAFHVTTSAPVVGYQMLPYGGGSAAVTGATLLLPTNVFGTNYIATGGYHGIDGTGWAAPSMNIVASQDDTTVTILPKVALIPGGSVQAAKANVPAAYKLNAGEHLQFTQSADFAGSPIQSDKPVALFAGVPCVGVPTGANYCDHIEQQIPSVQQLGHEYMAVAYRQRNNTPESVPWRIIGAVDGTQLKYSRSVGGPSVVNSGDIVELASGSPFIISSQDADHPFFFAGYMTGAGSIYDPQSDEGYGDPDFVRAVPTDQYMNRYVFFTDPTYPETNLVVTRTRGKDGYSDVTLECAGVLGDWQPLDANHQYTRIDLVRHDFVPQNGCDNGRHEMTSPQTFGLTVWGWGTPETKTFTGYVSYGYPAGQNVAQLTQVSVPVIPH